jgi:arylsulfatase A-like enzyme
LPSSAGANEIPSNPAGALTPASSQAVGRKSQKVYWEFHERGFDQAVRMGDWKAVRKGLRGAVELYDLASDPGETRDVAAANPAVVKRVTEILRTARTDSAEFPVGERPPAKKNP